MSREVSLALLTWKSPITLAATLERLTKILHLFNDRLIVCQESDPKEIELAEKYGFRAIRLEQNVGIQNGLKRAVTECLNEQVVLLENDCMLEAPEDLVLRQLNAIGELIESGVIDYARLARLPRRPRDRFKKYWKYSDYALKRRPLGYVRYMTADAVASEVVSCNLPEYFSSDYLKAGREGVFLTQSRYCHWSNRAVYVTKAFFLERLIPFAEAHPTSREVNGKPDLEHVINSLWRRTWWRTQGFRVAITKPGMFTHRRFDRDASDEKWETGAAVVPALAELSRGE